MSKIDKVQVPNTYCRIFLWNFPTISSSLALPYVTPSQEGKFHAVDELYKHAIKRSEEQLGQGDLGDFCGQLMTAHILPRSFNNKISTVGVGI